MAEIPSQTSGSCLCGAVQYTLLNGYGNRVLCHCNSCRKTSGSTFMANSFCDEKVKSTCGKCQAMEPRETNRSNLAQNLKITQGESIRVYHDPSPDSGNVMDRSFCGTCGSPLFTRNESLFPGFVIVAAGSLEGIQGEDCPVEREWIPQLEYYSKRKAKWYANSGTELKHAGA